MEASAPRPVVRPDARRLIKPDVRTCRDLPGPFASSSSRPRRMRCRRVRCLRRLAAMAAFLEAFFAAISRETALNAQHLVWSLCSRTSNTRNNAFNKTSLINRARLSAQVRQLQHAPDILRDGKDDQIALLFFLDVDGKSHRLRRKNRKRMPRIYR